MKSLIVSLHDVAPGSFEMVRRWMELLGERNLPVSMLVIPGPWAGGNLATDESFQTWLKQVSMERHEVVLHGFSHQAKFHFPVKPWKVASGCVLARGCEEFWAINHTDARQRMMNGLAVFSQLGYAHLGLLRRVGWPPTRQLTQCVIWALSTQTTIYELTTWLPIENTSHQLFVSAPVLFQAELFCV